MTASPRSMRYSFCMSSSFWRTFSAFASDGNSMTTRSLMPGLHLSTDNSLGSVRRMRLQSHWSSYSRNSIHLSGEGLRSLNANPDRSGNFGTHSARAYRNSLAEDARRAKSRAIVVLHPSTDLQKQGYANGCWTRRRRQRSTFKNDKQETRGDHGSKALLKRSRPGDWGTIHGRKFWVVEIKTWEKRGEHEVARLPRGRGAGAKEECGDRTDPDIRADH